MKSNDKPSVAPTTDELENAAVYYLSLDYSVDYPGSILEESGQVRWRFETQPRRSAYSPFNLLEKPVFVILDAESHEVLLIRKSPSASRQFDIIQDGTIVGIIRKRAILRPIYTLDFPSGSTWTVRMPLFSIQFQAQSTSGVTVWIRVGPSKKQWNVLVPAEGNNVCVIAALAFIHREWWCYS